MNGSPEILALHGNLGSSADWESLGLPGTRTVDLWDFVRLGFREFAGALAVELSDGMERPVLAGYSLGGRLALHALALHPQRWSGAVIVAAHPGLCCVEDRIARRSSDSVWAERARIWAWEEFLASWNGQGLFGEVSEPLLARQRALEARREAVAEAFERWSLGAQEDLRPALGAFAGPVLWISGERDVRFRAVGEEMATVFPDFRHCIVPSCGHRVLDEGGGEVAAAIRQIRRRELPVDY
ncbi:MAG TPA: alpha/beta fold hydrolase [Bacteroidia bacterium]|nr:alpha/beta fold hydrolase [Bacteroidia bacterium]